MRISADVNSLLWWVHLNNPTLRIPALSYKDVGEFDPTDISLIFHEEYLFDSWIFDRANSGQRPVPTRVSAYDPLGCLKGCMAEMLTWGTHESTDRLKADLDRSFPDWGTSVKLWLSHFRNTRIPIDRFSLRRIATLSHPAFHEFRDDIGEIKQLVTQWHPCINSNLIAPYTVGDFRELCQLKIAAHADKINVQGSLFYLDQLHWQPM